MSRNKIPNIIVEKKVCIICEGAEEFEYLTEIEKLNVWNKKYKISLEDAGGNGNIFARYQDKYQNSSHDIILIFCDTEKKPYEQYNDIKRKLREFHGFDDYDNAIDEAIIFVNPCSMQIILLHWDDIVLKTNSKKMNSSIIESLTGVSGYNGTAKKRKGILSLLTVENYNDMVIRVKKLSENDTCIGSSNFNRLIEYLSSDNDSWIDNINKTLTNSEY